MSVILYIEENGKIRKVPLGLKAIFLGRASSCHIQLDDPMTSSKHLAIKIGKEGKAVVKDLESTNGTYLNDYRIMESYIYLEDEIKIGNVKIWIDSASMNQREKELHTREGQKTNITFVKLKEYEQQKHGSPFRNIKPELSGDTKSHVSKKIEASPQPNVANKIQDKVSAKAKEVASKAPQTEVGVDQVMDLEDSTGQTKLIKIDKKDAKKKSVSKPKKEEKEEGFADKFLKLFKK
ncbi:MAG: hypothetical protein Fur0010_28720 [Bdellovibrio sp.]